MNQDPRSDPSVPSLDDPNEIIRQAAVDELDILDTPEENRFDVIVNLARQLYGAESAAFTILDRKRVWHKAKAGTDVDEAERSNSFCSIAIKGEGTMVIPDARLDHVPHPVPTRRQLAWPKERRRRWLPYRRD